ncbi:hypothetical protein HJG60_010906 [Phyllostomus discolor]|uniref:Uncharacterized protein n=1 Tax=Phyllostomus discolor TaxID=89673 RepID=A0A834E6J1_9CHIR|nr:hypothetical protein HJG60_010906 [Phyllostomus discolor]
MIFPGNGSLSTTHAQDLERCQLGLHNKELTSPHHQLCGTQVTLGMHAISEATHFLQAFPALVASITQSCVYLQGAPGSSPGTAYQPLQSCICFARSTWSKHAAARPRRMPSLDPFFSLNAESE